LAYQAEKQLSDLGDKVPAADKTKVEGLVKDRRLSLRTTMSGSRHSCLNCNRLCLLSAATSINKVVAAMTAGPSPDDSSSTSCKRQR